MYIAGRDELDKRIIQAQEVIQAYNASLNEVGWTPDRTEQMVRLSARGMYLLEEMIFEAGQLVKQMEARDAATLPQRDPGATLPAETALPLEFPATVPADGH